VICGYKHANFWRNRDDYGLKRRVTVSNITLPGTHGTSDLLYETNKF